MAQVSWRIAFIIPETRPCLLLLHCFFFYCYSANSREFSSLVYISLSSTGLARGEAEVYRFSPGQSQTFRYDYRHVDRDRFVWSAPGCDDDSGQQHVVNQRKGLGDVCFIIIVFFFSPLAGSIPESSVTNGMLRSRKELATGGYTSPFE